MSEPAEHDLGLIECVVWCKCGESFGGESEGTALARWGDHVDDVERRRLIDRLH